MKLSKFIFALSIVLNIFLIAFSYFRYDANEKAFDDISTMMMSDFVELESAIDYQIKMKWVDESVILEKIEDIKENLYAIEVYGSGSGLTNQQSNDDLMALEHFLSRYPEYTGFPNAELTKNEREELIQLRNKLRRAGLAMNISFTGGWDNFLISVKEIIKE
ncbi:hypothetical protein NQ117_15300 [Paenibacillus sp. SC116]|uniref:hypothetical protein n=1 Tax=Paenibacillus sp. SC116 TaxID=2968986 RepID=UPI00215B07F9|nr:hypothetical protein [Paenibacillus sp. SC116]MCR8845048.1 hypothetical protein [Paenibacillus sp. SC116]